jgi:hypothetical protein
MVTRSADSLSHSGLRFRSTKGRAVDRRQSLSTFAVTSVRHLLFEAVSQCLGLFQNFPYAAGHPHHLRDTCSGPSWHALSRACHPCGDDTNLKHGGGSGWPNDHVHTLVYVPHPDCVAVGTGSDTDIHVMTPR